MVSFTARKPEKNEKIFKEECMYCFNNPESEGGLFICLQTFHGICGKHLPLHNQRYGYTDYLHYFRIRSKKERAAEREPDQKITKLAIGVEGGFQPDEKLYEFEENWTLFKFPEFEEIALSDSRISEEVRSACDSLIASDSAYRLQELEALAGTWDGAFLMETKHKNLKQIDNPPKIPNKGWKCEAEGCQFTENLWLNLTDGKIFCGRRNFDGTGGNNHAIEYYTKTKNPLAVKLGTITPHSADVFSYDEDEMVADEKLSEHLKHFGINMIEMEKTDKTMLEMELDLNQRFEYSAIQEEGAKLQPVYGPGYTGMVNLGSSCYINSSIQSLLQIPEFRQKFCSNAENFFLQSTDPAEDFNVQMAKLVSGLVSGDYSKPPPFEDAEPPISNGIRPLAFRSLVGRGHPEFSSKRQQDAHEYLLHLFDKIEQQSKNGNNPIDAFRFEIEERTECNTSKQVRYHRSLQVVLSIPVATEATRNRSEIQEFEAKKAAMEAEGKRMKPEEIVRPRVALEDCLEKFSSEQILDDYFSDAIKSKTTATRNLRLATFPDFLWIHMQKFTLKEDWTPLKLDVELIVPDALDLEWMRAKGPQPGEQLMADDGEGKKIKPQIQIDAGVVNLLMEMGFTEAACRKAVYLTKNSGAEVASEWLMQNVGDPDLNQPHPDLISNAAGVGVDQGMVDQLVALGFSSAQAKHALKQTEWAGNNVEHAAEWLFTNPDAVIPMETDNNSGGGGGGGAGSASGSSGSQGGSTNSKCHDGPGKYRLIGFISHMGSSTQCGHYVCHLLKNGRWIIFNDEKVAFSEKPPKGLAYIYLYERIK